MLNGSQHGKKKRGWRFIFYKKQEEYILYRLGQALSLGNPRKMDEIMSKVKYEYEKLADDN